MNKMTQLRHLSEGIMSIFKEVKDHLVKLVFLDLGPVHELHAYLTNHGPINFHYESSEDGIILAKSTNFVYGSIITTGRDLKEVDINIKDAILTAFDIPSSYMAEAGIQKVGEEDGAYATA